VNKIGRIRFVSRLFPLHLKDIVVVVVVVVVVVLMFVILLLLS